MAASEAQGARLILCAAGDIHGALDRFYQEVLAFEESLGVSFECVLQVGDFGVWPDPERIDRATRNHEGAGDFPAWHAKRRAVPRPTVFIKGNHEDFDWLHRQHSKEILPGLTWLPNGRVIQIGQGKRALRVGGIGGCYSPSDYERQPSSLRGYERRHYTHSEVSSLSASDRMDVLLLHDAPDGMRFLRRRPDGSKAPYLSQAAGLADLVRRTRPRLCFFGHHHQRARAKIEGVDCIGLAIIGRPGHLVAIEMETPGTQWRVIGEWPPEPSASL